MQIKAEGRTVKLQELHLWGLHRGRKRKEATAAQKYLPKANEEKEQDRERGKIQ